MAFGLYEDSDASDRIKWLKENRGLSAEALENHRKRRGGWFAGAPSSEETRHHLSKEDSWFKTTNNKTVKKALDKENKKKRGLFW
jgi:hypothetical protein